MAEPRSSSNLENSRSSIPSNGELIDSLVSNLEDCIVNEPVVDSNNSDKSSLEISESVASKNNKAIDNSDKPSAFDSCKPKCENEASSLKPDDNDEGDQNLKDDELPTLEDDLIDELTMKDLELTYTDEDKQRLRREADGCKLKGNELFKSGEYKESALGYTQALRTCPLEFSKERAILYSNRAAAKMKMELNESAIEDCTKALELDEGYLKALFRRAQLYEVTDKLDEALADYNKILTIDPLHKEAIYASKRLPDQIQERNEKLKAEMMGKLKDLGNMFLRPFGLSTENFQLNQDPNSGGYSINFKS